MWSGGKCGVGEGVEWGRCGVRKVWSGGKCGVGEGVEWGRCGVRKAWSGGKCGVGEGVEWGSFSQWTRALLEGDIQCYC